MIPKITRYRPIVNISIVLLTPLLLSPLIFQDQHFKCFYIILLMGIFWLTNALPIAVTAMLPLLLSPILKINPSSIVSAAYSSDSLFLSFGRLFIACAFQQHNIHKRLTLKLLSVFHPQMKWILLAFMVSAYILSTFISNSAAAALMMDLVVDYTTILRVTEVEPDSDSDDVFENLKPYRELRNSRQDGHQHKRRSGLEMREIIENKRNTLTSISIHVKEQGITKRQSVIFQEKRLQTISTALALATTYSSAVAAAGSLVSCSSNLILYGFFQKNYDYNTNLNYATFIVFGVPFGVLSLFIIWLLICNLYLGPREFFYKREAYSKEKKLHLKIKEQYKDLGPISIGEIFSVILTLLLFLMWFTRNYNETGWKVWFQDENNTYATDVQPMILVVILLFVLPVNYVLEILPNKKFDKQSNSLLCWRTVSKNFNWSSLFLLGSGFAVVELCNKSKLTNYVADSIFEMSNLDNTAIILISSMFCTTATEFFSATTLYPVLLPIFTCLAHKRGVNPLIYGLSLTLSSSFAFSTPIATASNIAAFNKNLAKPMDFLKTGIFLDIIFLLLICLFVSTYGRYIFSLDEFPVWANRTKLNCNIDI